MDHAQLAPAPPGFKWAYNRLSKPYEGPQAQFDGIEYPFKASEYRLLHEPIAEFLHSQAIVSYDMGSNKGRHALVLEGKPGFGEPMDAPQGDELIDRSSGDNPTGKGTGGLKTHAARVATGSRV